MPLRTKKMQDRIDIFYFLFPVLILLAILIVYPILNAIYTSFFETNFVNKWEFVGLANYAKIFSANELLGRLGITFTYTALVVIGQFLLGIGLALLLNAHFRGKTLFRVIFILPWLFSEVVASLLWKWLLNPVYGLVNMYMLQLGIISEPISWFGTTGYAMAAIVIVTIWKGFPFIVIMTLSGLQSISISLYEAATIDGASRYSKFIHITMPSLKNILLVGLILTSVWWFRHFTMIWLLTAGGSGTNVLSTSIYKMSFSYFRFGEAAAMSVIVFLICLGMGLAYMRALKND